MSSTDGTSLARLVIMEAIAGGRTLAVAESLTAGMVCARLAEIPGASGALQGGVVAYQNHLKNTLLGVDSALLERVGAVAPDVAAQMATGIRRAARADIGVSTTGAAGPEAHGGKPVGTVYVGVASESGSEVRAYVFEGSREQVRRQAAEAALQALLDALEAKVPD